MDRKVSKAGQTRLIIYDGGSTGICQMAHTRQIFASTREFFRISTIYAVSNCPPYVKWRAVFQEQFECVSFTETIEGRSERTEISVTAFCLNMTFL